MDANQISKSPAGSMQVDGQLVRREPMYVGTRERGRRPSASDSGLITPAFVLRVFSQWWYVAIPIGILLACLAAVVVFLLFTPVYRAAAVIQIASRAPYIAYEADDAPLTTEEFVETQIELLRSSIVMELVMENPSVADMDEIKEQSNPIDWLANRVKIDQIGNSELYNVSIDDADTNVSALLVNSVVDAYFSVRNLDDHSRTDRVIQLLEEEKAQRAAEVQRLREKMRTLSQETIGRDPFTDLPLGSADTRHPLQMIQEQFTEAEVSRRMLEVDIQVLNESIEAKMAVAVPDVHIELTVDASDEIRELRKMLSEKKLLMHRVENISRQGKQSPEYLRAKQEVEYYEYQIEKAAQTTRPNVAKQLESIAILDRRDALARKKVELELSKKIEAMHRKNFDDKLAEVSKSGDKSLELEFTRSELEREEQVFKLIAERMMALATEMRAPGRVSVLKRAEAARFPVEKIPLRNIALAGFACSCLPFGIILLWELSQRRICDVSQLSKQTPSMIVREVAKMGGNRGLGGRRDTRLFEESIDCLRVGLQLTDQNVDDAKIHAVVSAVQGEGKTSVATQLALSVARATGQPTLLIDADMRAPDIHQIFELSNSKGLAQVLGGECEFDDAVVTTWSECVHILPAGILNKSPHILVGSGNLEALLGDLRLRYCNIIVDTPPILSASESLIIARLADRTVFCAKRNRSRERQVRLAYEHLIAAGVNPAGVVLSAVAARQYSYTYGRYDYSA